MCCDHPGYRSESRARIPVSYILPSRLAKYEALYDTDVKGGSKFRQRDREQSLQALMTVNLLKRLESSVHSFRLSLQRLKDNHLATLDKIETFKKTGPRAIQIGIG